jgi:hypothetical protein
MVLGVVILVVFGLLMIGAVARLLWRAWHGDIEIESTSHGRQLLGGSDDGRDTSRRRLSRRRGA